jgi:hypothetical protein
MVMGSNSFASSIRGAAANSSIRAENTTGFRRIITILSLIGGKYDHVDLFSI